MANKKEIIKWVELQIKKEYKSLLPNLSKEDVILECNSHIKDRLIAEMVSFFIQHSYDNEYSCLRYEFTKDIDTTSELFNPIKKIMENIHRKEEFIINSNKEIKEYNEGLTIKLAKFKEDMLLIGNRELSNYAQEFIENLKK